MRKKLALSCGLLLLVKATAYAQCKETWPLFKPQNTPLEKLYEGLPYRTGEFLRLDVSYLGLHAGYLDLEVLRPTFLNQHWLMGLSVSIRTGDWYEKIYKAQDDGIAYVYPGSFTPYQFQFLQANKPLIGSGYFEDKTLHFDPINCEVLEVMKDKKGEITKSLKAYFEPDALDILGAVYQLRNQDFVKNKTAEIKVYTSEKNWWLKAERIDFVNVKVPAGSFDAVKLKLDTYLGKELQQQGKATLWLAFQHPNKPIVKIEADIRVGSFIAVLSKYSIPPIEPAPTPKVEEVPPPKKEEKAPPKIP